MASRAIELSEPLDNFVEEKVRSGDYKDRTQVIEQALILMKDDDSRLQRLQDAINLGLDELDAGLGIDVTDAKIWLDGLGR